MFSNPLLEFNDGLRVLFDQVPFVHDNDAPLPFLVNESPDTGILVGHFFSLDLGFLGREAPAVKAADLRHRAVDTVRIHSWVEQQRHRHAGGYAVPEHTLNLVALALSHGIRVGGAHNALTDAFITAQLLQRQLRALPALGVRTLGDLLRVGKP